MFKIASFFLGCGLIPSGVTINPRYSISSRRKSCCYWHGVSIDCHDVGDDILCGFQRWS